MGAPWTLLIYILNKKSPKKQIENKDIENQKIVNNLLKIIDKYLKIHIKNQIKAGASVIQIFDSWAGIVEDKNLKNYIYLH